MRLKKEEVAGLSGQIAASLKKIGCQFKADEATVIGKIASIIQKNINQELGIEEEVKRLMERYKGDVASQSVDPQRAYQMIKRQVAKEKKFIL